MASLKDTSITGTLSVSGAPTFTTAIPLASGGTGATSASAALTNLGAQAALVSGTNIKTVGGTSILGSGNITVAADGLGVGQTWQDVTTSRAFGTTYTNSTGKPIVIYMNGSSSGYAGNLGFKVYINGTYRYSSGFYTMTGNNYPNVQGVVVPNGATYSIVNISTITCSLSMWYELR